MEPLGEFEETLALIKQVLEASDGAEDPSIYDRVHYWMGHTLGNLGRYDEARSHLFRSLELAGNSGNRDTEADAYSYLSQLDYMQGYLDRALRHADASIRCSQHITDPKRLARAFVVKALPVAYLKGVSDYMVFFKEASFHVEQSGNDRARCLLLSTDWAYSIICGEYETVIVNAQDGLELARKIGDGMLTGLFFSIWGGQRFMQAELSMH